MLKKSKKGFTLIELLIVVAIIGLLASVVLVWLSNARAQARDAERLGEAGTLRTALELYFNDYGEYPEATEWLKIEEDADTNGSFSQVMELYLSQMPRDPLYPKVEDEKEFSYQYQSTEDGGDYKIHLEMETKEDHEVYSSGGGEIVYVPKGTGPENPYKIYDVNDLQAIKENLDGYYELANDIDTSETQTWNGGQGFEPIDGFSGYFDGKGYKITGLYINRTDTWYVGLFGRANAGSEVKNVGLLEVNVSGKDQVGGLVGKNQGRVSNCYSTGNVSCSHQGVGGLVGYNGGTVSGSYSTASVSGDIYDTGGLIGENRGTVTDSYSNGIVNGQNNVGGLVGTNTGGSISDSYSTGNVSGKDNVGGLAGRNAYSGATISNSYATGTVNGTGFHIGGLVGVNGGTGYNNETISNCYSSGNVNGVYYVGGLVAGQYGGLISNSYATGDVTGSSYYVGGFVGNVSGPISNSYSLGSVSGADYIGGFAGRSFGTISDCFWDVETSGQTTSDGGIGKTTAEMKQQSTFTNWDFDIIWDIIENEAYPFLRVFTQ